MAFPSSLPSARSLDPLLAPTLRWGILGPGWIAERFVKSLKENTKQDIVAVGARSATGAQAFADRWSIGKAYSSTAELVAAPDIDVVYVSTSHHQHFPCALAAIEA